MTDEDETLPILLSKVTPGEKKMSYKLIRKIGSGGFATVFYAEEIPGQTPIAIKRILKTRISGAKAKRKIISEIEIQRSLHHPHIVEYRGVFQDSTYVYILLEYCPGGSVSEEFKKNPPFSEERTSQIVKQLLLALEYLHLHRVIHRDLKLQNLLFDANGCVKVADFGLSAQMKEDEDKKTTLCGTPGYLSPEVVVGGKNGHTFSVDVWATGVCTFYMLTGKQPFQAGDKKATFKKISLVDYSWPEKPDVSEVAKNFIDCILQKDPEQRPSVAELLEHPFILREKMNNSMPDYMVRVWWDYSHRYGLAYILDNHICGACFNDSSRIILSPHEDFSQYYATPHSPEPEVILMTDLETHPLRKKLLLILHFAQELKQHSASLMHPPAQMSSPNFLMPHVKYWAKTRDGMLFRMACRDVQANFKDHSS